MRHSTTILRQATEIFEKRNAVYKDSTGGAGEILSILQRYGNMRLETPDDFRRHHILSLIVVKLVRYCNNWNEWVMDIAGGGGESNIVQVKQVGHQDSIHDLLVYAAILESIDQEINEQQVPF